MPCLSQMLWFLLSPSFQQAQSALIGQLTQSIVIGRTPQARVGNVILIHISIIPSDTVCDTVHIENCTFWLVTLNGQTGKCIANADNLQNTKYCLMLYVSLAMSVNNF